MKVEVSDGELLDKLSILEIKQRFILDETALEFVGREFKELHSAALGLLSSSDIACLYEQLVEVNKEIWSCMEEVFRNRNLNDPGYRDAVEKSIDLNLKRSFIKRSINDVTFSKLREVKSYFAENDVKK